MTSWLRIVSVGVFALILTAWLCFVSVPSQSLNLNANHVAMSATIESSRKHGDRIYFVTTKNEVKAATNG